MEKAKDRQSLAALDRDSLIAKALRLARSCKYERGHSHQVCRLALNLFDELAGLHKLSEGARALLEAGALLHDIGWVRGQKKHHKTSQQIIMNDATLPVSYEQRLVIGLIARYHRKNMPKKSHAYFCELDKKGQECVRKLAALVRQADGFDRSHTSCVKMIRCTITRAAVVLRAYANRRSEEDLLAALGKTDLLSKTCKRAVRIEWHLQKAGLPPLR